ncbi:transcriptional regulator [Sphingopyxis sp.]|uniref:transcriptional regulator n=1 Tax=Sphingopyxis sp. TaxID=1908224 RepID=UPI003F722700
MDTESAFPVLARDVVLRLGSQVALAKLVGVTQQSVSEWCLKGKPIPPLHVLKVEAATGIACHDLRPDIYPRDAAAVPGGTASGGAGGASTPARAEAVPDSLSGLTA